MGRGGEKVDAEQPLMCFLWSSLLLSCFFLGDVLFQMAEVHRQIQNQLEEMVSALLPVDMSFFAEVCQGAVCKMFDVCGSKIHLL